jgi:hypothetical protein
MGGLMQGQQTGATSSLSIDPYFRNQLDLTAGRAYNEANALGDAARSTAPQLFTNFQSFNPQLNTNFQGPQFSQGLDAYSKNTIAAGTQAQNERLGTMQAQNNAQFRSNPALARALNAQAAARTQLSQNPLFFQAAQQQRAREGQEFQLAQQAQALGNNAQLQQTEARANLAGLQNSALGQRLQMQAMPMQAQGNLLAMLAGHAGTVGTRNDGSQFGKSPMEKYSLGYNIFDGIF